MELMRNKAVLVGLVAVALLLLVVFRGTQAPGPHLDVTEQAALQTQSVDTSRPVEEDASGRDLTGVPDTTGSPNATNVEPTTSSAAQRQESSGPPNLFFLTEQEFVSVATHWSDERQKDTSGWIVRLEAELAREDSAPNSRDLEQSAASVVVRDPRYSYDPPLSVSDLQPSCRNSVCKIEIPASVRVTSDFSAPRMVEGSRLNSYQSVLFSHGFGHHIVLPSRATGTTTHYFLGNGFGLTE